MRDKIASAYDSVIADLGDRARLIKSERKDLGVEDCVRQAIDDGFYWSEDRAVVLAWSFENGLITWGSDVDWIAIEENMVDDIVNAIKGDNE